MVWHYISDILTWYIFHQPDALHLPVSHGVTNSELNMLLNHFTALAKHIKAVWQLPPGRQIISTPLIPLLLTIIKSCTVINVPNKDIDFYKTSQEENTYIWYKKSTGGPSIFLCIFNFAGSHFSYDAGFHLSSSDFDYWVMEKSLPIALTLIRRDVLQRKINTFFGCL